MALSITQDQYATAQSYVAAGNYVGGWGYLASVGDNYADNAYAVTSGNPSNIIDQGFEILVEKHWDNTAGQGAYADKFDSVAKQHFEQYVKAIDPLNNYQLPTSAQIEESYRTAVTQNGLPAETAFDGVFTNTIGNLADAFWPGPKSDGLDWTDFLSMEDARQVESSAFNDIDKQKAWEILLKDALQTSEALIQKGLNEAAQAWDQILDDMAKAFLNFSFGLGDSINDIERFVNDFWNAARNWIQRIDPLALDLNNNGIETISANGTVLFDHDGDGIKNGTGWLKPTDGWLVLDRNSDGLINSGKELFGVDTVKSNGQKATDAFDALKDLDANADGKINATDAVFTKLRVWTDKNSDGISQADELTSLANNNITAINLTATTKNTNLGNGNVEASAATFIRTDGSSGELVEVSSSASALDLQNNPFYRQFPPITLSDTAKTLPDMQASGAVRNLREAATLSSDLATALTNYKNQTTRAGQLAQLDNLLTAWANSSTLKTSRASVGIWDLVYLIPGLTKDNYMDFSSITNVYGSGGNGDNSTSTNALPTAEELAAQAAEEQRIDALRVQREALVKMIDTLERFNGTQFVRIQSDSVVTGGGRVFAAITNSSGSSNTGGSSGGGIVAISTGVYVDLSSAQVDSITKSYNALKESVYQGLLLQTRLKPYLDSIQLTLDDSGIHFDFSQLDAKLTAFKQTDSVSELYDLIELNRYVGKTLYPLGWDGLTLLQQQVTAAANSPQLQAALTEVHVVSGSGALSGSDNADIIFGGNTADNISGGNGDDILIGGTGNDTLSGGDGSDIYVFNKGDGQDTINNYDYLGNKTDIIQFTDINPDEIQLSRISTPQGYYSTDDLQISVKGSSDRITITNYFFQDGNGGYQLDQIKFADGTTWSINDIKNKFLVGSENADTINGYASDDTIFGNGASDIIHGKAGADVTNGGSGDDSLYGDEGDDTLVGGTSNDYLDAGYGNDTYIFSKGFGQDTINSYDYLSNKTDTIQFTDINSDEIQLNRISTPQGYYSTDDLQISVKGSSDRITITNYFYQDATGPYRIDRIQFANGTILEKINLGTANADILTGTDKNDYIDGGLGADTLIGGKGNDVYLVDNVGDKITENANEGTDTVQSSITYTLGTTLENLTLTGSDAINAIGNTANNILIGNAANNTLTGNAGDDTLDGGLGIDTLIGGIGNDLYVVDNSADLITEGAGQGTDTVQASVTYTLATNVENLTLTGIGLISATGNTGVNIITGNTANNILNGGAAADTLIGGLGDDTYIVDNAADKITENSNEGTDLIQSSVTYTVSANVENLILTGTNAVSAVGNELKNILTGNSANNTLNGGAGIDTLIGNLGNDTYIIDDANDKIIENLNEGTDFVQSSVTYSLSDNLESLTLTGTAAINGIGNSLNNKIIGNAADNILDGGTGADSFIGGLGNDTYIINSTGDTITENLSEGTDTVQSSITYTLGNNVENLTLTGTTAIHAIGNELNNILTGNSANNTLNGGTGADTLIGGAGNDTYVIDDLNDKITELSGGGVDTVIASVNITTLFAFAERLTLSGSAIRGGGNSDNNIIQGNDLNNILDGKGGADTLDGGLGADSLIGGLGNDTYLFNVSGGKDVIAESAGSDSLLFGAGINANQLWLQHTGNNLVLTRIGTADSVTIKDWYTTQTATNNTHLETFKSGDGKTLLDTAVENLVQAMASFAPPVAGTTTLPTNYQTALNTLIAASWR